jgi:hypothetical protein
MFLKQKYFGFNVTNINFDFNITFEHDLICFEHDLDFDFDFVSHETF